MPSVFPARYGCGCAALPLDLEPERGFDQGIDVGTREIEVGEDVAAMQTGRGDARGRVVDPGEDLTARPGCVVAVDDCLHRSCRSSGHGRAEGVQEHRLLQMEPVLGLVEDDRARAIGHGGFDLLIPMHGQAMHEHRGRLGRAHDPGGHFVRCQGYRSCGGVGLTHADVNVGVDSVSATGRRHRIVGDDDLGTRRRWSRRATARG